jgi:hypothetical protein
VLLSGGMVAAASGVLDVGCWLGWWVAK